jgi:hypothetical protein
MFTRSEKCRSATAAQCHRLIQMLPVLFFPLHLREVHCRNCIIHRSISIVSHSLAKLLYSSIYRAIKFELNFAQIDQWLFIATAIELASTEIEFQWETLPIPSSVPFGEQSEPRRFFEVIITV